MKKGLTVHMIVHNEEQWIWYAIASVLPYAAEILITNTGSTDGTAKIIQSINSSKITLTNYHSVDVTELVQLRNQHIKQTKTDWFLLLDGDEVWPNQSIKEFVETTESPPTALYGIVVKAILPVGDLFHYQSESAGRYTIIGKTGHYNIRGYKIDKNYMWKGMYPLEAYTDQQGLALQNKSEALHLLKNPYWHMTHLVRSSQDTHRKRKIEIGEKKKYTIPEVFYKERPSNVPSPWVSFSPAEKVAAYALTPLLKIKRALIT